MPSWKPVRLPHDVMIGSARNPSDGPGNAYFPGGTWEYQKKFVAPEQSRGKRMFIEFEGVYRDAVVSVNGSFAAHHPYGYTGFTVAIDHLVRHGEENEVRVGGHGARGCSLVLGRRNLPKCETGGGRVSSSPIGQSVGDDAGDR